MPAEAPVVLVTGAAGRLGSALARALSVRGAELVLSDTSGAALEGGVVADVRDERQVRALVGASLARFGRIDAVVNNAGIEGPVAPLEELVVEEVVDVYDVNVFGAMRVLQALIPHFKERGAGRIVNVASGAGLAGTEYMAAYSSSKHALVGLTRSLAREVARYGISVNAVCPGVIESPMMERIEARLGEIRAEDVSFSASVPAGRYASAAEVAELVAYLALDAPIYLTGAAVVIDGALRA